MDFATQWLTGIILGSNISQADESKVRMWNVQGGRRVIWKRAAMDPKEFRIDVLPA